MKKISFLLCLLSLFSFVTANAASYERNGQWLIVKPGDASSLLAAINAANSQNTSSSAARLFIFVPDGTYDLGQTVKIAITARNLSIIGQSMENTIIVTTPDVSIEGLGKADLLEPKTNDLYLQDLTLKNALDYYHAGSAGRAPVFQDSGNRTIGKRVRMLSYQDTYYSSNSNQQAYWEDCDIHGTVDFICGGGDIRFQHTTISLEPRSANGTGSRTITAPTTKTSFGYVFDQCTIVDLAKGKGNWNFGRTWKQYPICVYLNTTLDNYAKSTIISTRWIEKGMNETDPKLFGEYGTKTVNGTLITPVSNIIHSYGGNFQTILTADQAASFAYDKMFTNWDPAALATQVDAPAATYNNGVVTWTLLPSAVAYALFRNGAFVGLTTGISYDITIDALQDELTIRAANRMGGFGPATHVHGTFTAISDPLSPHSSYLVYNLNGQRIKNAVHGLNIVNGKKVLFAPLP